MKNEMMTPDEKRKWAKKVGIVTAIIGAVIFIALLIIPMVL